MNHAVYLKLSDTTYQRFEAIRHNLNAGVKESQSRALGDVLSEVACEVINQAFGELLQKQRQNSVSNGNAAMLAESEKAIQQILDTLRKYMPWSVSFFGNERLLPLANYLHQSIRQDSQQQVYLSYAVDDATTQHAISTAAKVREGQMGEVATSFKNLTQIVDMGVTALIREPKKMLKFNLVVDKTLNGVINMTTHMGYKRLEKLGGQLNQATANDYIEHFMTFLRPAP